MERRDIDDAAADAAVLSALRSRGGVATRADLEVATSLPDMVVERAVTRLTGQYESSIAVAEGGALVYHFQKDFHRRREQAVMLRAVLTWLAHVAFAVGHAARTVFRIALGLQLVVYTFMICLPVAAVAGVVVGVVLLVAGAFSDDSGGAIEALTNPYVLVIALAVCVVAGIGWAVKKEWGLLLELVGARQLKARQTGLPALVTRVNSFAVGPELPPGLDERVDRTWTISRADERRVLERVRAAGGVLRAGDLVDWLGLSLDAADSQATRIAVEHGGEPAAADSSDEYAAAAVVEFRFASLMTTARGGAKVGAGPTKTRFERGAELPVLTGNDASHDRFITLFALLNLGAAFLANHWLAHRRHEGKWWWMAWLMGAAVPIGFSCVLLVAPLLRLPLYTWRKVRALVARARGRMLQAMVRHARANGPSAVNLEALAAHVGDDPRLPPPTPSEMRAVALELGGQFDLDSADDPSKTVWYFRRLAAELRKPRGGRRDGGLVVATELAES